MGKPTKKPCKTFKLKKTAPQYISTKPKPILTNEQHETGRVKALNRNYKTKKNTKTTQNHREWS